MYTENVCIVLLFIFKHNRKMNNESDIDPWKQMHDCKGKCIELSREVAKKSIDYNGPKVYVQFASFLDPQLIPTIHDMLEKADNPEALTFGICWQYGDDEDPNTFDGIHTFRVYKAHYSESTGLGWARHITNALWAGEEFTLQLDSHHRFALHWDTMLMEDFKQAQEMGFKKPVITTYTPQYCPYEPMPPMNSVSGQPLPFEPTLMAPYEFSTERLLMSRVSYLPNWRALNRVVRTRTLSAHFIFTDGVFCREVNYDPECFYGGYLEEQNLSARAWTNGYDFFSPHRVYLVHDYSRKYRAKIWEKRDTSALDMIAHRRLWQLLGQDDLGINLGPYGLGTLRTLEQYQKFIGIDFKDCKITNETLSLQEPGTAVVDVNVTIKLDLEKIKDDCSKQHSELRYITVGFETGSGEVLHRSDMSAGAYPDVFAFKQDSIIMSFRSHTQPDKYVMWTLFEDGSWGSRQEGTCV